MRTGLEGFGLGPADDRTPDAILRRLLREASEAIPGLSPDPKQADPVVVMLLKAFSREYADLYKELDNTVELAYRALVMRLLQFPRGPKPATTVLEIESKDPTVAVPSSLEVLCERPVTDRQGRSYPAHFTPVSDTRMSAFDPAYIAYVGTDGRGLLWTVRAGRIRKGMEGEAESFAAPGPACPFLLVALEGQDVVHEDPCTVFLMGPDSAVNGCLWGRWSIAGPDQMVPIPIVQDRGSFWVPALRDDPGVAEDPEFFSFRTTSRNIRSAYETRFVPLGGEALLRAPAVSPAAGGTELPALLAPARGVRSWIRIDLDPRLTLADLEGLFLTTRAILAANREPRTTGALDLDNSPAQIWMLPEDVTRSNLLAIDEVTDLRSGHAFLPDLPDREPGPRMYRLTEVEDARGARLAVRLHTDQPPSAGVRVEIRYSLCLGPIANGLASGSVRVIFSPKDFPGIVSATSLVPTLGGEPAPSVSDADFALRSLLRTRGRAVSRLDYRDLARAYDPGRVMDVEIGRGVKMGSRGPVACIEAVVKTRPGAFGSDLERRVFRDRLERYLLDRAPAGTHLRLGIRES